MRVGAKSGEASLMRARSAWRAPSRVIALAVALGALGCAGHAAQTEAARSALDANRPREALRLFNKVLKVKSAEELPEKTTGKSTLLLLDRAMVLQQLDDYTTSSRDLEVADKAIEMLDFSRNAVHDIGKYLYSDASGPYKAPAYEKLFINTMNMVNYLARGNLSGARVEARRLAVMQKFLKDGKNPAQALTGPGSYLAGFVFEKSRSADEALRFYDEALAYGENYRSLVGPVQRLAERSNYRSPRIQRILDAAQPTPAAGPAPDAPGAAPSEGAPLTDANFAELLVVVSFGRVPAKEAKRVPIGLALTYASGILSPMNVERANRLAAQGLVTWVNYPELGEPRGSYERPYFRLGPTSPTNASARTELMGLEALMAVDQEARAEWERVQGVVVASAITRMVTRLAAGTVVQKAAGDDNVLGFLLSLGTQATLTAVDTPDTRSWSTLPARIAVGRVRVAPGSYSVVLGASGQEKRERVTLAPGGWAVVNLTVLR
jgi:hypothetical protein